MAKLTVFTSSTNPLTKRLWVDGRKESLTLSKGTFEVRDVVEHDDLRALIKSLTRYQALSYTTPLGLTSGKIVTMGMRSMTRDNFPNQEIFQLSKWQGLVVY